jgi:hypothetical protein
LKADLAKSKLIKHIKTVDIIQISFNFQLFIT